MSYLGEGPAGPAVTPVDRQSEFVEDLPSAMDAFLDIDSSLVVRTVKQALWKGFVFAWAITPVCYFLLFIGASSMNQSSVGDNFGAGSEGGTDEFALVFVVAALLWFAAWVVPWFMRTHVYAGNWQALVEDRAEAAESAIVLTYEHLRSKGSPATLDGRRMTSALGGPERFYLIARQGPYVAYVSALPYGTDLFTSWTMWRVHAPASMVFRWAYERLSALAGKGELFHQVVRNDPARALREMVHNATRVGAARAAAGERASITEAFGVVPAGVIQDQRANAVFFGGAPGGVDSSPGTTPGTTPGAPAGGWPAPDAGRQAPAAWGPTAGQPPQQARDHRPPPPAWGAAPGPHASGTQAPGSRPAPPPPDAPAPRG